MIFHIRLSDYRALFRPYGPFFAMFVPWILVLLGHFSNLSHLIVPGFSIFHLIIIGNLFSLLFLAFVLQTFFPCPLAKNDCSIENLTISKKLKWMIYTLLILYASLQLFQAIYFKGFPLFHLLKGSTLTYMDYGIKSLNGFLNAIYLFATTGLYLIYLKSKSKAKLLLLLGLCCIPILIISRQVMISLFLQMACCAMIYNPKAALKFFKIGFVITILFIVIGNMRTTLNALIYIVQPYDTVPQWLYPLMWIYAYVVTPFNNIHAFIDVIHPIGAPYHEIASLFPTVLRSFVSEFISYEDTGFSLVHPNMTVSTFYFEPMLDFGKWYAFGFMILFQLLLLYSFRRAMTSKSLIHVMEYAVLYMIMILSIFSNLFLFLPVITQLVILNLLKFRWRSVPAHFKFETSPA